MRELGLYDDAEGVDAAYADVAALAARVPVPRLRAPLRTRLRRRRRHRRRLAGPGPLRAWRKLQAEAHRQLLRVDARARAAERARLRAFHRALREQPNRPR